MIVDENNIHFYVNVDKEFIDYCDLYKINSSLSRDLNRWRVGDVIKIRKSCIVESNVCFARGTSIFNCGSFTYSRSDLGSDVKVGRYTSIADNVTIPYPNHPINDFSTSPVFYDRKFSLSRELNIEEENLIGFKQRPHPVIGNDCWIGSNVIIMPGVNIGDGAIVGAGSVVTKSVPPYAIVGGNPARVLKYRFDENTILRLQKLTWFNYEPKLLSNLAKLPINDFIDRLEEQYSGLNKYESNARKIYFDLTSKRHNVFGIWISPSDDRTLPQDVKANVKAWKTTHPHYSFKIYTYEECMEIIGEHMLGFPIAKLIKSCRFLAMKSDVLRLAMIYKIGGIYTDLKNKPTCQFLDNLHEDKVYICEHPPTKNRPNPTGYYYNAFISAPPGATFIKDTLIEVLNNIQNKVEDGGVYAVSGGSTMMKVLTRVTNYTSYYELEGMRHQDVWGSTMVRTSASYNSSGHWSELQKTESLYL